jgi:O-antigen ligase
MGMTGRSATCAAFLPPPPGSVNTRPQAPTDKSFLVLFFKKEHSSFPPYRLFTASPGSAYPPTAGGSLAHRMPKLMLAVCAYLLALPFLPPQVMSVGLFALAALFVFQEQADGGYGFLLPVLPFLAVMLLAAARAPDWGVATAVLSFQLPGLVLFIIMLRRPDIPVRHWMVAFTLFSAAICLSVIVGWVRVRLGARLPVLVETPEGALLYANDLLLIVPNDICVAAILLAFPLALLASGTASRATRGLALATIGLTALAMAILRTRTGVMVALTELAVVTVIWPRIVLWALAAGLLLAASDQLIGSHTIEKLIHANSTDNHGVAGRLGLWVSAWDMFRTAPLLGHGAQSFGPQHGVYLPPWSPRFPERHVMWAHSLYLETLAEQGLAGIAALTILFWHPLCQSWTGVLRFRGSSIQRVRLVCAFAGLAGFLVAAGLEVSFIRRWAAVAMFGLIGFAWRTEGATGTERRDMTTGENAGALSKMN